MSKNSVKLILIHLSLIGALMSFQNCGQSFETQKIENLGLPSEDGTLDDGSNDPQPPPSLGVCETGDSEVGYLVESALYPMNCGSLITNACVDGNWDRAETLHPACQQMCVHPQTGQAAAAGAMYYTFTSAQANTQALCDASRVTSVCSQETGLFSPAPAANTSCMVQGQVCAYTTGNGIASPSGNMTGATVMGYGAQSATYPTLCGSQVTRTCQSSGSWSGSTPLYSSCQQLCMHPDSNQPVAQGSNYIYYTRQSGSETECQAARVSSICQAATGLYNPAPSQARFQSCTVTVPPPGEGGPTVSLQATRMTGVAPLAVMFDATATTSSRTQTPIHHLIYEFNFGDDRGSNWSLTGLPKNSQRGGPVASHVFDNPGTYTVRARAIDSTGASNEQSLTITVQDPNSVYSGNQTICVSTSANYSGCPAGALQQTALPSSWSQRRVLLRRGESFAGISIPHGTSQVLIGAFGSGAKPRVNSVSIGTISPPNSNFPSEITAMDLNILNSYTQNVTGSRLLIYRCDFAVPEYQGAVAQISLASALGYIVQNHSLSADQYYQPREIFVVENLVHGSTSRPLVNMVGEGSRIAIMGNDMGTAQQHTIRMFAMHKGFIAHNALRGVSSDGIRVALKLHSGGLGDYNDNYALSRATWASRQVVIANNIFSSPQDNNSFTGGAGPENNTSESRQGLEDIILENNLFYRGPNTNTEFIMMGRRMTTRGNTRADGGVPNINQFDNSFQLLPPEWDGPYFRQ